MTNKIYRSIFFSAMLVVLASLAFIMGILFRFFEGQIIKELKSEAGYLAYSIEQDGTALFDNFHDNDRRITLIAPDGTVIADTSGDAETLDNHLGRKEVQLALKNGSGTSIRYSNTLTEKTVYYAKLLTDGNILRVSTRQYTVVTVLLGILHPLLIVLILAFILSFLLASRLSKSLLKPINNLDLENPENNATYEELTPLLRKIADQKETITKQLEQAYQKQNEFRLITENMSEGFLVIDSKTNLLSYNSAALRLLKAEGEDPENSSVLTLNRTADFREAVNTVLTGKRAEHTMSYESFTYQLIANPVWDHERVIGGVIIILDITESARREALRREFTANVSHELKTPLTSISGFAELLKAGGTPPEVTADFAASIYEESQRLISLVSDIIRLSELDEGAIEYPKEDVDLFQLTEEVTTRLKPAAAKKHIAMHLLGDTAVVHGVRKILDEMIYNLCDNAIKYNRESGTVNAIITKSDENVTLTIQDTGIGIPLSEQNRIFERFYRVDKGRSKAMGGTGLGLSIVKHGAMYHHAKIQLESTVNEGTTITVTFPAV